MCYYWQAVLPESINVEASILSVQIDDRQFIYKTSDVHLVFLISDPCPNNKFTIPPDCFTKPKPNTNFSPIPHP